MEFKLLFIVFVLLVVYLINCYTKQPRKGNKKMEVINYFEQSPTGNVVAIFDFTVPALGMVFRNWKLLRGKNGKLFTASPSFSKEINGEKKWNALFEVGENRRKEFNKALMEALNPFLRPSDMQF